MTLEPLARFIWVSFLPAALVLEFISKPITVLFSKFVKSEASKYAVTFFPEARFILALWIAIFLTNNLELLSAVPKTTFFLFISWSILYADKPSIVVIL